MNFGHVPKLRFFGVKIFGQNLTQIRSCELVSFSMNIIEYLEFLQKFDYFIFVLVQFCHKSQFIVNSIALNTLKESDMTSRQSDNNL